MQSLYKINCTILQFLLLFSSFSIASIAYGQKSANKKAPSKIYANYCLEFDNYYAGLNEFERLLSSDTSNAYYKWGVGYCHLNLNIDKSKSIPYFEDVLSKPKPDKAIWYDLGNAYLQSELLVKAEQAFTNYINSKIADEHTITATRQIEYIKNARLAIKNPINAEVTNAGSVINTEFPDFNPYINASETYIAFSKQGDLNIGRQRQDDGYYASDVFYSNFKSGKWKRVKRLPSIINTREIEINGYLSNSASFIYICRQDLVGKTKTHLIYNKQGRSFKTPTTISIPNTDMNTIESIAISNNKKLLVYSAPTTKKNRKDLDLFYCKLKPTGRWSKPVLLDSMVNTEYDESFPYFAPGEAKFIFASKGHNSIGGYDLFYSDINNNNTFSISNIENIGYPVNTTKDDKTISITTSGRYGYISGLREGGFGNLDIYRVVFKDKQPLLTVIHGDIFNQDSTKMLEILANTNNHIDTLNFPINRKYKRILRRKDSIVANKYLSSHKIPHKKLDVSIDVINKETNKLAGNFIVKESTGRYNIIIPPGRYNITFSRKGYEDIIIEDLIIEDYDLRNRNIEMPIIMIKKVVSSI
ncbi:MAG: hypothetical protein KAG84_00150 [Bacteroidales bacterium]|nr:hypothetical protein [Bacteroidales bacterium]